MNTENLEDDAAMQEKLRKLRESVDKIENILEVALNSFDYNTFSVQDKVNYDLFLAYVLNTLYWIYLRTKGVDPNTTDVKHELGRIREYMVKAKKAHERNTIRPRVDRAVAGRFVKHGISYADQTQEPHPKKKK